MIHGCKVFEPSGKVRIMSDDDRTSAVGKVLEKWSGYCDRNWLNDSGDLFSPESKVKRLLDSLAYYLLLGHTRDIETEYRRVMHAKREIPLSNCPSSIADLVYASGATVEHRHSDDALSFATMTQRLDEIAEAYEQQVKPKPVQKKESLFEKKLRLGIHGGEWCVVDTEGYFWCGQNRYHIADNAVQYQPVKTEIGDLYDMDRVLVSGGKFYDMNLDEVEVFQAGGIVQAGPDGALGFMCGNPA